MGLLNENDLFKEDIVKKLSDKIPNIEQKVLDEIFSIIDKLDSQGGYFTSGVLTSEKLLEISQVINQALAKYGYVDSVETFISDFGKVTINTTNLLENVGGYSFRKLALSDIEKKWISATSESLLGSGINEGFKRPILQILDNTISYGSSIDEAKQQLKDFISGKKDKTGKLKSYITQTARDSVSQMQGQQFQSISNNIETVGIRYVGGVLNDSRGQCTRWVRELKGFIPWEQLDAEIKLTYKNQALKLEKPEGHKWGGFMPDTNRSNFLVKRGGYNCTHTAVPVRKKPI